MFNKSSQKTLFIVITILDTLDDQMDFHNETSLSFEYSCELCSFKAEREGQFLKHVLIHGKV